MANFVEVCIYDVKNDKINEFEALIKDVVEHHKNYDGVVDVKYMKRTHRQNDFNKVKNGEPPIKLTRKQDSSTYVLYWELESPELHGKLTGLALEKFYKSFKITLLSLLKLQLDIIGRTICS